MCRRCHNALTFPYEHEYELPAYLVGSPMSGIYLETGTEDIGWSFHKGYHNVHY